MSRRRRNLTIGLIVVLMLAVEVGYQVSRGRTACVVVTNMCPEPMEGLKLVCGRSSATVGVVRAGESARVYLSGGGKQTIVLTYRQKGNSLQGFEVAGFDLAAMSRERNRLMITIRPNEFERFQEEDEPAWYSKLITSSLRWLEDSLKSP